jgi:CD109 antigen
LWGVDIACAFSRFYTVVAPRVLRPNSEYHVAITTQETSQPTTVTVAVSGKQHGGGMFEASQTVSVEPYTTHIVKLEVRDIFMCCTFYTFWKNV